MIPYDGSGQPIADDVMVKVKLRDCEAPREKDYAKNWFWEWYDKRDDPVTCMEIVAYEIVD